MEAEEKVKYFHWERSAWRALGYELGLLHTKVIKSLFCCLTESQQMGKLEIYMFLHFHNFSRLRCVLTDQRLSGADGSDH